MKRNVFVSSLVGAGVAVLGSGVVLTSCVGGNDGGAGGGGGGEEEKKLVVYSGRSQSLVEPIFKKFTEQTGIEVEARYGATADHAQALKAEGDATPADVFFAQDAGALGYVGGEGLLAQLPESVQGMVPGEFSGPGGDWVGVTGRSRVLSYSPERVPADELPASVFDLTDPKWKGRIGWPPPNASFQSFVTAMRVMHGEEKTEQWLRDMKANDPIDYPKNTPAVEAIANGEIDVALVNHYYRYKLAANFGGDGEYPVKNHYFKPGDVGSMVNVAGVGILKHAQRPNNARKFVEFLLGAEAQQMFASANFELPLASGIEPPAGLPKVETLHQAEVDLAKLDDLAGTVALLRKTGVLP